MRVGLPFKVTTCCSIFPELIYKQYLVFAICICYLHISVLPNWSDLRKICLQVKASFKCKLFQGCKSVEIVYFVSGCASCWVNCHED